MIKSLTRILTLLMMLCLGCGVAFAQSPGITVVTVSTSATPTLTANAGITNFVWTLTQNVTSSTFSSPAVGYGTLNLCENGTGGWTVVLPVNFLAFRPLASTAINYCQTYNWYYDGTNVNAIGAGYPSSGSLPLGAGASPITETWTVGTGGVTANSLVQTDASNPSKIVATTTAAYGIALSTVSSGGTVEVARFGTMNCVTDTGGATAGDLVIIAIR